MQLEMFDTINLEPDYDVNSKTRLCPKCNIHKPKNLFSLTDLSYTNNGKKRGYIPTGNSLYCKPCFKFYSDSLNRLHRENAKPNNLVFCDCSFVFSFWNSGICTISGLILVFQFGHHF